MKPTPLQSEKLQLLDNLRLNIDNLNEEDLEIIQSLSNKGYNKHYLSEIKNEAYNIGFIYGEYAGYKQSLVENIFL